MVAVSFFRGLTVTVLCATRVRLAVSISLATRMVQPQQSEQLFANHGASKGRLGSWQEELATNPSLFEGCKDVFLDVGSNRGTHVRKLFEPFNYPTAKYLEVFHEVFGPGRHRPFSETGLCAFGFEANPRWAPRLRAIEKHYAAKNWRVKFFAPSVVSNETGRAEFWINNKGKSSDWGASEFKDEGSAGEKFLVSKLDMPYFMKHMAALTKPGFKLMKMDIEGGEYTVLPPLLEQGLLCADTLNRMTIEWHREPGRLTLGSLSNVWAFEQNVTDKERCLPKASTEVLSFDDESYREDGVPIPGFSDDEDANPEGKEWAHTGLHAGTGTNCRGNQC